MSRLDKTGHLAWLPRRGLQTQPTPDAKERQRVVLGTMPGKTPVEDKMG